MAPAPPFEDGARAHLPATSDIPSSTEPESAHAAAPAYETVSTVPQIYGQHRKQPGPGAVVGITLGAVAGFLLLLAFIYWCINIGRGPRMLEEGSVGGGSASVVSRHSRPRPQRVRKRRETVEVRRGSRRPVSVPDGGGRDEQIIVEEYGRVPRRSPSRSRSRAGRRSSPLPPRMVPMSDTDDGDAEIVVEEENSTPPRRRRDSVRSHRTRRSDDRRSAYRDDLYVRDVSRRRSSSRR